MAVTSEKSETRLNSNQETRKQKNKIEDAIKADNPKKTNINEQQTIITVNSAKKVPAARKYHKIENEIISSAYILVPETMATYYTQYQIPQICSFPMIPNIYTSPILHFSAPIISPPQYLAPVCPYTGSLVITEPVVPTVLAHNVANNVTPVIYDDIIYNQVYDSINYTQELISPCTDNVSDQIKYNDNEVVIPQQAPEAFETKSTENEDIDPLELYLKLPKDLFPSARMLTIDANIIIDEFCKVENLSGNVSWILDLEFGVPRVPVTRAIAVYDVKFNSVHCKNAPNAIHPGFEKCSNDFKRVLLFYYDCIVSNWYNGYIIMNYDKSVENFQSWLLKPMQVLGMCWS